MIKDFNHIPVMPREAVSALAIRPGGVYVDGTLGGGGHSALILSQLNGSGRLLGIDRDINAIAAASKRLNTAQIHEGYKTEFEAIHGNFHDLPQILHDRNLDKVDGVLLDLGVSSHQLDTPERGFSYRYPGRLDMRMNQDTGLTAYDIVNTYPEERLADILYNLGEERKSRRIAKAIVNARQQAPIDTTLELSAIIEKAMPRYGNKAQPHPAMRSFMALRIAVNDELHPLDGVLENIVNYLNPGGRISVITFHSLEDRIVKTCFNQLAAPCTCPRDIPYCVCGKPPLMRVITKKPILPSVEELASNSRATSAKLRIGERI